MQDEHINTRAYKRCDEVHNRRDRFLGHPKNLSVYHLFLEWRGSLPQVRRQDLVGRHLRTRRRVLEVEQRVTTAAGNVQKLGRLPWQSGFGTVLGQHSLQPMEAPSGRKLQLLRFLEEGTDLAAMNEAQESRFVAHKLSTAAE